MGANAIPTKDWEMSPVIIPGTSASVFWTSSNAQKG